MHTASPGTADTNSPCVALGVSTPTAGDSKHTLDIFPCQATLTVHFSLYSQTRE